MVKTDNTTAVIELNGRLYDAVNGALLGRTSDRPSTKSDPASHQTVHQPEQQPSLVHRPGRALDGIVGKRKQPSTSHKPALPKTPQPSSVAQSTPKQESKPKPHPKSSSRVATTLKRHQPQHSKTLMRGSVAKPIIPSKTAIKSQLPMAYGRQALPGGKLVLKHSAAQVQPERAERAHQTVKSQAVHKYGAPVQTTLKPQIVPVRPIAVDLSPKAQPPKDLFEQALEQATSHLEMAPGLPRHQRQRNRMFASGLALVALVIVVGFVAYSNMPSIELKIASLHAGFSANLPAYQPADFAKSGAVQYGSHQIKIGFVSTDHRRSYQVIQTVSPWDSAALYDNLIAGTGVPYTTEQQKGNTVYLYGDSQAAWVSGGVLYQIVGNARLNTQQLLKIASSL